MVNIKFVQNNFPISYVYYLYIIIYFLFFEIKVKLPEVRNDLLEDTLKAFDDFKNKQKSV